MTKTQKDCAGVSGEFTAGGACATAETLGVCALGKAPEQSLVVVASTDATQCGVNRTGCEFFGGGFWQDGPSCGGVGDEGLVVLDKPFLLPQRVCVSPKPSEAPGRSEGGQVCAYTGMHGATEEGRSYLEVSTCEVAFSQRAYAPVPPSDFYATADARRSDPAYLAEEAWVTSQVRAQSCVCCHSEAVPSGGAVFGVDRAGSFANQFNASGLALGAGWKDSTPLGGWPAADNNGFAKSDLLDRSRSIFMSTDAARMRRFFESELAYRGLSRADVDALPDPIKPLTDALAFKPSDCAGGEGVAADGTVSWGKGRARYLYVLESDATSPSVPPNLDLPAGTRWRLDVPAAGAPLRSGTVRYGQTPTGATQRFPEGTVPPPLVTGQRYYLAAFADVLLPISRCLFTAP